MIPFRVNVDIERYRTFPMQYVGTSLVVSHDCHPARPLHGGGRGQGCFVLLSSPYVLHFVTCRCPMFLDSIVIHDTQQFMQYQCS